MRLPNSYGSVYKLSGKRRRPWAVAKTVDWTDDGKQIKKIIGYATSRSEALKILAEYNNDPYDVDLSKITFKELYDKWLKEIEKRVNEGKLSNKRLTSYKSIFKYYEKVSDMPFISINDQHLQKIIDECVHGYDTKINIKILYNQIFKYAKRIDVPLKKNYSEFVDIGEKVKSSLHKPFTDEELLDLWDHIDNIENIDIILIMCTSGIRPGELVKIETKNIYLEEHYIIGGSKTEAGKDRIIPINDDVYEFIVRRYNPDNKYLFAISANEHLTYRSLSICFEKIMKKLNMKHLPHDGRHTFATKMDELKANKNCIKIIMGHVINDITDGTYTHKSIQDLLDTVNLFKKSDLKRNIAEKV